MTVADPDLDLLADLDAGLLDPERAAAVRAAADADPRAAAVLAALAATRAELGAVPTPPVPPAAARSWAAALAAAAPSSAAGLAEQDGLRPVIGTERPAATPAHDPAVASDRAPDPPPVAGSATGPASGRPPAPPADRAPRRRRLVRGRPGVPNRPTGPARRRGLLWRRAGVAAAALAVVLAAGIVVVTGSADRAAGPRTDLAGVDLVAVARSTIGTDELGPLDAPGPRAACLSRWDAVDDLAGGRTVRFEGSPGVLLVLTTGVLGRFRVVVVDETCSTVLADATFGG